MVETEQEEVIYVLGLWELPFGERGIYGVYTDASKLLEGYQKIMEGDVRCWPFTDYIREPVIYRFPANEFLGEMKEWNDNKVLVEEMEYEISIEEVQEEIELRKQEG